jgi:S-adenosylmethionine synthetase
MALNLTKFKADLKTALLKAQAKNQKDGVDVDTAMENLANDIATEVDKYIRSGTVKTQVDVTSVTTTVTGTCATPAGAGTIAGSGSGTGSGNGTGYME